MDLEKGPNWAINRTNNNSKSLYRFKFKLPNNLDFNYTVFINIFYINGKLVLYVINKAIGFTAA